MTENEGLLNQEGWLTATLRTLRLIAGRGERLRIVDLGCLEGGYSIEFARCGHDVVGIDAREIHIERANAAKSDLGLRNVEFVVDDVKNLARYGRFDVVFCCGLLYHLDNPHEFIDLVGQVCDRAFILNTHYARAIDPLYDVDFDSSTEADRIDHSLSELVEHEGLAGRWYHEYDSSAPRSEVENHSWAAYSNSRSFWPTKPALLAACRNAGFDTVYEQHDFVDDIAHNQSGRISDRGMFCCVKLSSAASSQTMLDDAKRHAGRVARRMRSFVPTTSG